MSLVSDYFCTFTPHFQIQWSDPCVGSGRFRSYPQPPWISPSFFSVYYFSSQSRKPDWRRLPRHRTECLYGHYLEKEGTFDTGLRNSLVTNLSKYSPRLTLPNPTSSTTTRREYKRTEGDQDTVVLRVVARRDRCPRPSWTGPCPIFKVLRVLEPSSGVGYVLPSTIYLRVERVRTPSRGDFVLETSKGHLRTPLPGVYGPSRVRKYGW